MLTWATSFRQASSRSNRARSCFAPLPPVPPVAHDGFDAEPEPGEIPEPNAPPARPLACHTAGLWAYSPTETERAVNANQNLTYLSERHIGSSAYGCRRSVRT